MSRNSATKNLHLLSAYAFETGWRPHDGDWQTSNILNLRRLAAGTTALHEAAESDNVEVVAMLLDGGADVEARTFREKDQLSCLNGLGQVDVYTLWSKIIDVWREMFRGQLC